MLANSLFILVPGTRIELVQRLTPRDFKSLASTSSATRAEAISETPFGPISALGAHIKPSKYYQYLPRKALASLVPPG